MVRAPPVDVLRLEVTYTQRISCQARVLWQGHVYNRHGAAKHTYWMDRQKGIVQVYIHQAGFPLAEPRKLDKHKERRKLLVTGERINKDHVTARL